MRISDCGFEDSLSLINPQSEIRIPQSTCSYFTGRRHSPNRINQTYRIAAGPSVPPSTETVTEELSERER